MCMRKPISKSDLHTVGLYIVGVTCMLQGQVMADLIATPGIYDGVELNNFNPTPRATETRMRVKEDICTSS